MKTSNELKLTEILLWVCVAAAAFHLAYAWAVTNFLIVLYLFALAQLTRANTWRQAFYSGLGVGLLIAAGRLEFFWHIFFGGALALWVVYAVWVALFVVLGRLCVRELPFKSGWLLLPFLWCGLEYFRSELYYLRFSWLSPGFAFGVNPAQVPLNQIGVYGVGFLLAGIASAGAFLWRMSIFRAMALLVLGTGGLRLWGSACGADAPNPPAASIRIAGVQMEFPSEPEVALRLNELVRKVPQADLLVLSEYTFLEPIPEKIKNWCRENRRYLIVGGKDPAPAGNFYDTAFVIGPTGDIVFRQGKAVPIQFFKDGLPAPKQRLWDSPWGKLGICVCYDLSYSRVTDELIRLGAQALIVPTMDVADWGRTQHELHARVAPIRAAEYGVPIFRLASSGISQAADRTGCILASAPFPGDGAMLSSMLELRRPGRLPFDRRLALAATGVTGVLCLWFLIQSAGIRRSRLSSRRLESNATVGTTETGTLK